MRLHHLLCATSLACALTTSASAAAVVSGTITGTDSFLGYMGLMTNIQSSDGTTVLPDSGFAFCIEGSLHWPGIDVPRQYTVDTFATFLDSPETADKATAMLHYLIDRYYAPLREGQYGQRSGYGFNEAVWQLTKFDGTQASMSVVPDDDGQDPRGSDALYATIMGDLHDNFSSIAPGYRSTQYDIRFLKETDPTLQSVALVSELRNTVPEPSTLLLTVASTAGMVVVRRRRTAARAKP